MATKRSTVDRIIAQAGGAGRVSARNMFGEYGLYCDGKLVGLICDERLFVKPTAAGRAFLGGGAEVPPYPGAKPYLLVAGEAWDDSDRLSELIALSAAALPAAKARRKKAARS